MREIKFRAWVKKEKVMLSHSKLFRLDTSNEVPFLPLLEKFMTDYEVVQYTGLKDKNGREIYEKDITEIEVDGEIRRFVVNIKTVIREVVSHPSFDDEIAKVAITGVVFEWNGFELFPCVDENGDFDNMKMVVTGNVFENPELLEETK